MTCFPAGLHYLSTFSTRMSKITQKSMGLYANLSEKGCLDLSGDILPYMRTFPNMSNFNGHLLFQADRLSCSYLNPPGGTNFTLPVLILSLSGRRSNHSYGRFIH